MELNSGLVKEAIRLIGAEGLEYHIKEVARIPGATMTFMLNDGVVFPDEQRKQLVNLTGESIGFVYDAPYKRTLISRVIGKDVDRYKISIEEKIGVAHVPIDDLARRKPLTPPAASRLTTRA